MASLVLPHVLSHAEAAGCARMLAQAIGASSEPLAVVDASALEHFDSSALAVSLARGMSFAVTRMPARLRALAALYGVDGLMPDPEAVTA
jgi:phospholipid transport system transporter-binding protein